MRMRVLTLASMLVIAGFGSPAAAESTLPPTLELASLTGVRLFVRVSSEIPCTLVNDRLLLETKRTLSSANVTTLDGFDPAQPDWPILEVTVASMDLGKLCDVYVGLVLRANTTGAEVEGHHYYEYDEIWEDKISRFHRVDGLIDFVSLLLERQLRELSQGIADARKIYPDL